MQEQKRIKIIANLITQTGRRLAKEYKCKINELGITPEQVSLIANLINKKLILPQTGHFEFEQICKRAHYAKRQK